LTAPTKRAPTLYGIIAFKLIRGIFLLAIAMQVFHLVGTELRPHFEAAVRKVKLDPETVFFDRLGDRIEAVTPANVRWVATGTLLYGILSLAEGLGLVFRLRAAGLLVVAESGFFVPIEIYGLLKEFSVTIAVVLVLNAAIVLYLHRNRERLFRHG
jgi:uncharacterized membrane protein (DUF2068 family)